MLKPHIQILNERFISRYGVDRILLLMARHFSAMGARVSFGCLRYNEELFDRKTSVVKLPAFDRDIFENIDKFMNAEKAATDGMMAEWLVDKPDLILIGGWPFFDLAARAGALGVGSVFIDAGAVPHTGYAESSQSIQQELRRIRAQTLPFIDKILPISDFIRFSQTEPDRCSPEGVRTIHLGADHLRDAPLPPKEPKKKAKLRAPVHETSEAGKASAREEYKRRASLLNEFGMFDAIWYGKRYRAEIPAGMEPKAHFLNQGSYELRDPGPSFSAAVYLELHSDVAKAGMEPWFHYVVHGRGEERQTISVHEAERQYTHVYPLLARLRGYKQAGRKLILLGGRFEGGGYKNSMSAVHVLRGIREAVPSAMLLVLERPEHLPISSDMKRSVEGIGSPTDYELREIIRLADLTLSPSLWEGFNLPLVESQYEGCPSLAYACGSHPEVIADPWFLCLSETEMADKAVKILKQKAPAIAIANLDAYPDRFPWTRTLAEIWEEIADLLRRGLQPDRRGSRRLVFLDISGIAFNAMDPTAFRAVRSLCANLVHYSGLEVVFTVWDDLKQAFTLAGSDETGGLFSTLSAFGEGWVRGIGIDKLLMAAAQRCVLPPVLLFPLAPTSGALSARMDWARDRGVTCAAIAHDSAAGAQGAHFFEDMRALPHDYYRHMLAADALICTGRPVFEALLAYAEEQGLPLPRFCESLDTHPPFAGVPRAQVLSAPPGPEVRIVGIKARGSDETAQRLVMAFERLKERLPGRRITMTLAGFGEETAPDLPALLADAHFCICPSLSGGIDLLAAEARWMGLPFLCHGDGVGGESARDGGGCLTADMRSERSIEGALACLIEDESLYRRLAREAQSLPVHDWAPFVEGVARKLAVL